MQITDDIMKQFEEKVLASSPDWKPILDILKEKIANNTSFKSSLHQHPYFVGNWDVFWLAFYEFGEEIGVDYGEEISNKLKAYRQYAENCGVSYFYDEVALISDRPVKIKFDNDDRLHCEDGPAIQWKDGHSIYSWHGVKIPGEWIEDKENIDPSLCLTWENVEERRCLCEILGWINVLKQLNAKIIDEDKDPEIGTLVEVDIPEIGKARFIKVLCGTGREFAIPVAPEMKTALEAQASTWGLTVDEFIPPEVRT